MSKIFHEIEWKVYKKGVVINKGSQEGHSYLRNWVDFLRIHFLKTRGLLVKEDGTTVDVGYHSSWCNDWSNDPEFGFSVTAGENDDSYGLVVGYGTISPSPDDYKLEKKYLHGSGPGRLGYGNTKVSGVLLEDNKLKFSVERSFTNDYESSQDIKEVGLMFHYRQHAGGRIDVSGKVLIMRDVLDTILSVPAYATAVIRYNIFFVMG